MNNIAAKLKEIIDKEGPNVLLDSPYEVYLELLNNGTADRKTAAAILHTFLMDIPGLLADNGEHSLEGISKAIQRECFFRKNISDRIAEVYISLYSKENAGSWNSRQLAGLKSFMEQEWEIEWDGNAKWDGGQGYVECDYHATINIAPIEGKINDSTLDRMLRKNPFLSDEFIAEYFQDSLFAYLDSEFEEYCTCDDYYPPVGEDFEAESYAEDWCKDHGFELISFDGEGSTGDYEPKGDRWY